jgi:hypothetical protein
VKAVTEVFPLVPVTAAMTRGWRHQRDRATAIANAHRGNPPGQCGVQPALRDHGDGAGGDRRRDEFKTVGLTASNRHEHVAALDRAAVRRHASDLDRAGASLDLGVGGQNVGKLHQGSRSRATRARQDGFKRPRLTCFPAPRPA